MQRRTFLGLLGAGGAVAVLGKPARAAGAKHFTGYPGSFGVLFDATRCIGCRRCEAGCNQVNQLPAPAPQFGGVITLDALQSKAWWAPRVVPPKAAPNVLLIITPTTPVSACLAPSAA